MINAKSARDAVTTCRFCSHLRAESQAGNIDTPWMRDSEYAALVTIGSLVPGWSLICPVGHGLNLSAHYKDKAFWRFCQATAKIVDQNYGPVTIFEHGARHNSSPTGCGTNHAHLHLVPLSFDLAVETIRFDRTRAWERCLITEVEERSTGREYMFLSTKLNGPETEGLLCTPIEPISQFFRRVIANRIGLGDFFDYRRYPMMEIGQSSFERLSVAASSLQFARTAP